MDMSHAADATDNTNEPPENANKPPKNLNNPQENVNKCYQKECITYKPRGTIKTAHYRRILWHSS